MIASFEGFFGPLALGLDPPVIAPRASPPLRELFRPPFRLLSKAVASDFLDFGAAFALAEEDERLLLALLSLRFEEGLDFEDLEEERGARLLLELDLTFCFGLARALSSGCAGVVAGCRSEFV